MKNKGFTLIELLVVVAIIGILSAIVLAALGRARMQAKDSAVMSAVSSYRSQAELDFQGNFAGLCSSASLDEIETYIQSQGGTIDSCTDGLVEYRIVAGLPSSLAQAPAIVLTAYAAFENGFCINSLGSATRVNLAEVNNLTAPACVAGESGSGSGASYSWVCSFPKCTGGKCSSQLVPKCVDMSSGGKAVVENAFCSGQVIPTACSGTSSGSGAGR
jgi:prepilin-type N-terminal cleavage/methylation domain-containing protein